MDRRIKVIITYYVLLCMYAALPQFTLPRLWGLRMWEFLPSHWIYVLVSIGAIAPILIIFIQNRSVLRQRGSEEEAGSPSDKGFLLLSGAFVFLIGYCFYLFSAKTNFLGDGYEMLNIVATENPTLRVHNIGSVLLSRAVYDLLDENTADRARLAFSIIAGIGGIAFLLTAIVTARTFLKEFSTRVLFLLGLASGGFMLLFFGYVENYSTFVLIVFVFTIMGMGMIQEKVSKAWLLLLLPVAVFFHIFGVTLIPAALFILVRNTKLTKWFVRKSNGFKMASVAVIASLLLTAYFILTREFLFFYFAVLPIVEDQYTVSGYTMFSMMHLLDFANLLLLLVPALPLLLFTVTMTFRYQVRKQPVLHFLIILTLSTLAAAFLFDPKLGMPRDWDLFAFVGVPLSVMLYYLLLNKPQVKQYEYLASFLAILLGLFVLIPRVYCQVVPDAALNQVKTYFELDVKKNMQYIKLAEDYCMSHTDTARSKEFSRFFAKNYPEKFLNAQGEMLIDQGKFTEAIQLFDRAFEINPRLIGALFNKALCLIYMRRNDEAIELLRISIGLSPYNAKIHGHFALALMNSNKLAEAEENALLSHDLDPNDLLPISLLIKIYKSTGETEKSHEFIIKGAKLPQAPPVLLAEATQVYIQRREMRAANETLTKAIAKGLDNSIAVQLQSHIK